VLREEPRTGRIADFEFQFWECWEYDDNLPGSLQRHWFRSDTDLVAPTSDHMLHMLYRQKMGWLVAPAVTSQPQPSCTSEWDKRTTHTVLVRGEEVLLTICEHYTEASGGAPVSTKVIGPNGLITSSYPEMLERLGIAGEKRQSAIGTQHSAENQQSALGTRQSTKAKRLPLAVGARQAAAAENGNCDSEIDIPLDGESIAGVAPQHSAAMTGASEPDTNPPLRPPALSYGQRPRYIRVGDHDLEVTEYEYFSANDPKWIVAQKFVAPDGTETSTYQEMLQKLGGRPRPYLPEDEHRPALASNQAIQSPEKEGVPEMELTAQGTNAMDPSGTTANGEQPVPAQPAPAQPSPRNQVQDSHSQSPRLKRRITISDHPLFPNEFNTEGRTHTQNLMETIWFAEWLRTENPDLYEAALDSVKRKEYLARKGAEERIAADAAPRCQFIKADGERCGSPALKKRRFCYFHNQTNAERSSAQEFELPVLEDELAIQMAVTNVCRGLAKKNLEPKYATALLYGLQVASIAVKKAAAAKGKTKR